MWFSTCHAVSKTTSHSSLDNTLSNTQQPAFLGELRPYTPPRLQKHRFFVLRIARVRKEQRLKARTAPPNTRGYIPLTSITKGFSEGECRA